MVVLYSTNAKLKYLIRKNFYDDVHYVWCAEEFDSRQGDSRSLAKAVGVTSDPYSIYNQLRAVVSSRDRHTECITRWRADFISRAASAKSSGAIDEETHDEIVALATRDDVSLYEPVIYVIPRATLGARIELVKPKDRSGIGKEFIIKDLRGEEFSLISGL